MESQHFRAFPSSDGRLRCFIRKDVSHDGSPTVYWAHGDPPDIDALEACFIEAVDQASVTGDQPEVAERVDIRLAVVARGPEVRSKYPEAVEQIEALLAPSN